MSTYEIIRQFQSDNDVSQLLSRPGNIKDVAITVSQWQAIMIETFFGFLLVVLVQRTDVEIEPTLQMV